MEGGEVLRLYSERDNSKGEPTWTDVLDCYYYNVSVGSSRSSPLNFSTLSSIVDFFTPSSQSGQCTTLTRRLLFHQSLEESML